MPDASVAVMLAFTTSPSENSVSLMLNAERVGGVASTSGAGNAS